MSAFYDSLCSHIDDNLDVTFDAADARVIPSTDTVALKSGAASVDAAFLYADLAGSSKLAEVCPWQTTAKIIKAYLYVCSRIISVWKGEIRSFDGDRVMGVFMGETPCNDAVKCAREIDYTMYYALKPKAKAAFKSVANNSIPLNHCVGVDYGRAHAVRGGIRNNNDLLWIGKPPSFAAKLSDIRNYPREVYISKRVFDRLNDDQKTYDGKAMWETRDFEFAGNTETVYSTMIMKAP